MTSIVCTLERIRCPNDTDDFLGVVCPDCHGHVVIHQPDERRPDRLLGTCESCFAWFLLTPRAAVLLRLPEDAVLDEPPDSAASPARAAVAVPRGD